MVGGSVVLIVFHINIHSATRVPLSIAHIWAIPLSDARSTRAAALLTTEIKAAVSGTLCIRACSGTRGR